MTIPRIIPQRLLGHKEAAKYLGISPRQLDQLVQDGRIFQTRLPDTNRRLYDIFELDDFIANLKNNRTSTKPILNKSFSLNEIG